MIEQLGKFEKNTLALEVIGGFTEADEVLARKLFNEKLEMGYERVNILVKMDEYKVSKTEIKAFCEDLVFVMRNYKHLGHLAIVGHSKFLKVCVPLDNIFYQRESKGRMEKYFDVDQMDEAMDFVQT